jgi:hypothetical protein
MTVRNPYGKKLRPLIGGKDGYKGSAREVIDMNCLNKQEYINE